MTRSTQGGRLPGAILVVDDDAAVCRLLVRMLERMGCRVTTAASGEDALEMIRVETADFQVLLSDVSMPDMTGVELARLVKRENPSMEILLMSGDTEDSIEAPSINFHVAGFVDKPFTQKSLLQALRLCFG